MKHSTSPVRVAARVAFRAANILLVFLAGNFVGNAQPPDTFELPQSVWTQLSPHPRLFANGARWQALTQQVRQDPVSQRLFSVVRDTAERLLDQPPVVYRDTGAFWHGPMRQAQGRIFALAFTYRITGDDRFLNRARLEMQTLAELPNWYPQHFLDTAEGALGMAIGLDWLHDALPVEHRLSTNNKETLVRGPNELKNIGPNHLPCWEVLFQYFHPRRQLKWLKPEKLVQRNHAVDPRNSKKLCSADRKVSLSAKTNHDVTVPVSYTKSSKNGPGYTLSSGATSVTIPKGTISKAITLTAVNDSLVNGDQIVTATLGRPSNSAATLNSAKKTASVTIQDDDLPTV